MQGATLGDNMLLKTHNIYVMKPSIGKLSVNFMNFLLTFFNISSKFYLILGQ